MVICLERGADLHMAQLMPLPLTVSCFTKIQIGVTSLVPAHPGSPGKRAVNGCVCFIELEKNEKIQLHRKFTVTLLTTQSISESQDPESCVSGRGALEAR